MGPLGTRYSALGTPSAAAGAQPSPLPHIVRGYRCPAGSYHPGRAGHPIRFFIRHNTETRNAGGGVAPSLLYFVDEGGPQQKSVHHLVGRDGTRYDLVYRADVAYHCGISAWGDVRGDEAGIGRMNWHSLGMEFESSSTLGNPGDGYTDAQLWTGAYTEACSLISYGGLVVLDHKQIVVPPEERHDPSHFPYDLYLPRVAAWVRWLRGLPAAELARYCL